MAGYNALGAEPKALLTTEKTLLDGLKAAIRVLKDAPAQAAAFKTAHSGILGKTVSAVTIADEGDVNTALAAYNALSPAAKALLSTEKTLLDGLKAKIEEQTAPAQAAAFKTTHGEILAKTVDNVIIADEGAVDAALAAYNALSAAAKALLSTEKTLLDGLKTKIDALKAAAAFQTNHAGILAKTVDNVTIADEGDVDAALAAYNALSAAVKALLPTEKTLLDGLKAKIDALKAEAENFKAAHSVILSKTVSTVAFADTAAVNTALAAYNALSAAAKALLPTEKTLLDALKARVDTLGQGSLTLVYPMDAASGELSGGAIIIYKGQSNGTERHTLTLSGVFDSCQWLVDGALKGNADTLTLNAADYSPGIHQLSLEVTLNGGVYSKAGSFTVQ